MESKLKNITFDERGLIPAIVQDERTGEVLMLAYMNEESLNKTIETKETWFYSRSRQELWNKGATSGNKQKVSKLTLDCDSDALLVTVSPTGPACHTNETSCFFEDILQTKEDSRQVVHDLVEEIAERKDNPVEGSYTSYLFREGIDKVLKKIGEESSEVIIGAKNEDKKELTMEMADLVYHSLVLLNIADVDITDVKRELLHRSKK
ncbi:MAG TPA: bifunctional phosphoribosyl-AMP cyclohydrolase/phosphoribosyl-ATP diphosphatase HisIE [Pseudogracilibacillus sp.]|nr:bifunctional phosphoribosyl-AMP cyclohydrolase/phosphoribosyl-ATP diphosphatase HisIE [Pseudogracilibacillus sp.]